MALSVYGIKIKGEELSNFVLRMLQAINIHQIP